MLFTPDLLEFRQDKDSQRFYFSIESHRDAELEYTLHTEDNRHAIEFTSTFVPKAIRNKGIGTQLAEEGIRFAIENDYTIIPTCPFVRDYMESRSDYKKLIQK